MPKLITISIGTKSIEQRLTKHYASIARARLAVDDQRDIILGDIARVCGGATCTTVRGAYIMDNGDLVTEDTFKFEACVFSNDETKYSELLKLALLWKSTFGEEAVLMTAVELVRGELV